MGLKLHLVQPPLLWGLLDPTLPLLEASVHVWEMKTCRPPLLNQRQKPAQLTLFLPVFC